MIETYIAPVDHRRVSMCSTPSLTSISSWSYNVPSKTNQLTTYGTIERYDNEICGPKESLNYNASHEISSREKIQFYNFLCRNYERYLHDAFKWTVLV